MHNQPADNTERDSANGLVRVLGGFDATCIVAGAIIGVGIFFTPSQVARVAGSGGLALAAWAIGGLVALFGALTFGALGQMYPRTAGQYQILRDAYGPLWGFLFVFCNSTAILPGAIAIIAMVCTQYLSLAVSGAASPAHVQLGTAVVLIVALASANAAGVRWGAGVQTVTVVVKISILMLITLLAAFAAPSERCLAVSPATDGQMNGLAAVATLFAAMAPAFFAFGGWQHALWVAGEVRQPRRNLPLAIVTGVALVVVVYLMVNWAYLVLLDHRTVASSSALAADAVASVWPGAGRRVVAGAVAISAFSVLNAQLLSGPRLVYGLSLDGRFFSIFARTSSRFHTPASAIALLAGLGLVLLLAAGRDAVDKLVTGVVMIDSAFFALTGLALILLRRGRFRSGKRPLGYPWAPLLFVLGETGIVLGSYWDPTNRQAAVLGAAWIVAGVTFYLPVFRRPRRVRSDTAG